MAAQADVKASQADLRKAENEVAPNKCAKVYIEILAGRLEMPGYGAFKFSASEQSLKEKQHDGVFHGKLVGGRGLSARKTNLLRSKYQLSKTRETRFSDLTGDLKRSDRPSHRNGTAASANFDRGGCFPCSH